MSYKLKLLKFKDCAINSMIYRTYYNENLDEKLVYLESRDGLDFTGNIFRIVEELSTGKYGDLKIYVHAKPHVVNKIRSYQKNYNLKIDKIITKEAMATEILEKAKYIFTDSGIRPKYVKKEGQIFVNTWHGTPLKVMGKYNIPEEHRIGYVQYVMSSADYLIYPNDFMMERMLDSYYADKFYKGKILLEGYPRNSVFFDEKRRIEFKKLFNLENKEIFVYMPTFRGVIMDRDDEIQKDDVEDYLSELDLKLNDNQILLVKLHILNMANIDFSNFKHIIPFPNDFETYDVLNMADVLITDYSSVFFDFANTGNKIILFNYDEEDYKSYRGFYFPLDELPFPKVQTIDDLVNELNSPKNYDDSEFLKRFCTYERVDAVKYICKHIFSGENSCNELTLNHDKENVLIYAGSLLNNGITSSLKNLLSKLNLDEYNYFICFRQWDQNIVKNHRSIIEDLPEGVGFLPIKLNLALTVREKIMYNKFLETEDIVELPPSLKKAFKRSFDRNFASIDFKKIIDFDGYNKNESLMMAHSGERNVVWVHNDMINEIKTRHIQNYNVLKDVYSNSDDVCVVSKDLIDPTAKISGRSDNIRIIHNINDYNSIIENSKKELETEDATIVVGSSNIEDVLNKPGYKFISIGRFSPEKGHERLINAFKEFCNDYPDSHLIIIGGRGVLFEQTCELINGNDNITLIKNIANPMPILAKCDLFVFSSFYEGWGIVLMEADTLGIPIVSTDVVGTQWLRDYDGYLVENSQEGILKGMHDFAEGKVDTLNIDYDAFNDEVINNFNQLLEDN